jgi:hypothetical protein
MTTYYWLLLQIDEDANDEIKNIQLESYCDLYPFGNIVYYANYRDLWRITNTLKM